MTKEQVFEALSILRDVYGSFEFDQQKLNTWHRILKNQDPVKVLKNLEKHIRTNKFAPTISELIEEQIESKINNEHLSFMRNLRGEDFYGNH